MCGVCHMTPCPSGCPNAPEPEPLDTCSVCGDGIYEGDVYCDGEYGSICASCIEEIGAYELLEALGVELKTMIP